MTDGEEDALFPPPAVQAPQAQPVGPPGLQPTCRRCKRHHRPSLPCWAGRYCQRLRQAVFAIHGDICHLCGTPGADTVDHLQSRALGGLDSLENLRPAHRFCNTGRGAAPLSASPTRGDAAVSSPRW